MFARLARTVLVLGLATSTVACVAGTDSLESQGYDDGADALAMTDSDAELVLTLVNDPTTTVEFLDKTLNIDVRGAQNIIAHRNGPDGIYPSRDDNAFDSIAELDALPYVADTALLALKNWAVAHAGPPPELVEGVQFTSEQVKAVLWGVNGASMAELDVDVQLTSSAASSLVSHGPYTTIAAMGAAPYVGSSALATLRDYAVVWSAEMNGGASSQAGTYDGVVFDADTADVALSLAQTATTDQLLKGGLTSAGANAIVSHRPYATLADVSNAYGVGPATMTALHAYADSL